MSIRAGEREEEAGGIVDARIALVDPGVRIWQNQFISTVIKLRNNGRISVITVSHRSPREN